MTSSLGDASRWLIELRSDHRPVGLFLHAYEDEAGRDAGTEWDCDVTRALRFADRRTADQYIRDEVVADAVASPIPVVELLSVARDCGCAVAHICRHNAACSRLAPSAERGPAVA